MIPSPRIPLCVIILGSLLVRVTPVAGGETITTGFREEFDALHPPALVSQRQKGPGDAFTWSIVPEGVDGSHCLRVSANRTDRLGVAPGFSLWLPLQSTADTGPPAPDSSWVFQWVWKIADTRTSDGIQLVIKGDNAPSLAARRSHQIWTDPRGAFLVPPRQWVAHQMSWSELGVGGASPAKPPGWGLEINVSSPRNQVLWLDNVYFGPRATAPPLPVPIWRGRDGLDPVECSTGGFVSRLSPHQNPILFLPNRPGHRAYAYRIDARGHPVELADDLGLADVHGGIGGACLDLDNDGDRDVVVIREQAGGLGFYENTGWNRFRELEVAAVVDSVPAVVYQVAPCDLNEDGQIDLWVVRPDGVDWIYEGQEGIRFRRLSELPLVSQAESLRDALRLSCSVNYSVTPFDADGDGHTDIFVPSRAAEKHPLTILLFGTGKGTFDRAMVLNYWIPAAPRRSALPPGMSPEYREPGPVAEAATAVDLDSDGDFDLALARDRTTGDPPVPNDILLNDGTGKFEPSRSSWADLNVGRSEAILAADFDNDGWIDLYEVNHGPNRHLRNNRGSGILDVTNRSPFDNGTHSAMGLTADLNGDGAVDVVLFDEEEPLAHLELTNTLHAGNWIGVVPRGTASTRDAVGAKVRTYARGGLGNADSLLGYREHLQGVPFGSMNYGPSHFGLGARSTCDIEVTFLSGLVKEVRAAPAGQVLDVWEIRPGLSGLPDHLTALRSRCREFLRLLPEGGILAALLLLGLTLGLALSAAILLRPPPRWIRAAVAASVLALGSLLLALPSWERLPPAALAATALGFLLVPLRRRASAPSSVEEATAWRAFLDILSRNDAHSRKNLLAMERRLRTLAYEDLGEDRGVLQELLDRSIVRFRREDYARFTEVVGLGLRAFRKDSQTRQVLQEFKRAMDTIHDLCETGAPTSESHRNDCLDALVRVRSCGQWLRSRAEERMSLPAGVVIKHTLLRVRSSAEPVGGTVTSVAPELRDTVRLLVDRTNLDIVLDNLSRNSCEASLPEPPRIHLRWTTSPTTWKLHFMDDGPGIPEDLRDRIFEDGLSAKGKHRGTGLAEAKRAAERFLAVLKLDDETEGWGDGAGSDNGASEEAPGASIQLILKKVGSPPPGPAPTLEPWSQAR